MRTGRGLDLWPGPELAQTARPGTRVDISARPGTRPGSNLPNPARPGPGVVFQKIQKFQKNDTRTEFGPFEVTIAFAQLLQMENIPTVKKTAVPPNLTNATNT